MDSMEKLELLTLRLPDGIPVDRVAPGVLEMKAKKGFGFLFHLLHEDNIAVARGVFSKESEYEMHIHQEKEWILIYEGEMKVTLSPINEKNEETHILKEGDMLFIEPERTHYSSALENCEFIAITMPASKGFPDGL